MAGEAGQALLDLKKLLLERGHGFSFIQAMRLLRLLGGSPADAIAPAKRGSAKPVRVRPNLSLAFPPADIAMIEETGEGTGFSITANFLGLYGPSSPLPTFYTEELLDEANADESVSRDFLDIFNHRIFTLYYQACLKYDLFPQLRDEGGKAVKERLYCLLGLGDRVLSADMILSYKLIRYTGLVTQYPRSAWGLETMLRDAFRPSAARVIQCRKRTVKIPPRQRMRIGKSGSRLGEDSVMGREIEDRAGKFLVRMGPLNLCAFNDLLPGRPVHEKLAALTRFYLRDPLEFDVELILAESECRPACVGARRMARLGMDTWIFSGAAAVELSSVHPISWP